MVVQSNTCIQIYINGKPYIVEKDTMTYAELKRISKLESRSVIVWMVSENNTYIRSGVLEKDERIVPPLSAQVLNVYIQ